MGYPKETLDMAMEKTTILSGELKYGHYSLCHGKSDEEIPFWKTTMA